MEYFPVHLYPFTAYFYMLRYGKDHHMQLKLGDVSRIKIKNHDVLLPKTVGIIYGDTLKLAIRALVGQRNCFLKDMFL